VLLSGHVNQPVLRQWLRGAKTALIFALLYCAADIALDRFAFNDGWTIVWPLNGVTIAVLLMRPRSEWFAILLGVAVGTGIGELQLIPVGMEVLQRLCSVTEVLLSASLLPHFSTLDRWLRTPHVFLRFFAALIVGPGISGIMAAILFHHVNGEPYPQGFNDWATADALGIAMTMPLALSLRSAQMRSLFQRAALPKTLGVLALALASTVLIFSESRYPLLFLLYPVLLLVDSMLAFSGAAIAVLAVCLLSVYFTTHTQGPFGVWPADLLVGRDVALQIYLGFHLVALFPASIVLMERRRLARELRDSNARLSVLAAVDGLTEIANRRAFDQRFAQEWDRATLSRTPLALLMIDIDNFKQFNDLYGHSGGDRCLRAVAGVLSKHVDAPQNMVARIGGEEFAVLLPCTGLDQARGVAEELRAAILNLDIDHLGNSWRRVTVSIGCGAATPPHGKGESGLLQLADAALYQAKQKGRNCVETLASTEEIRALSDLDGGSAKQRLLRILKGGAR
jgi:diguanylate cyclase (GGDEF)-like protein